MDGSPATSQEELKREENTYSTRQELVQESKNNEIIAKVFDWAV